MFNTDRTIIRKSLANPIDGSDLPSGKQGSQKEISFRSFQMRLPEDTTLLNI